MSARELVVLGTASQAPTRYRNHNGYFLRWDAEGILFDPGEGTQRQFLLAGVSPTAITRVCVSHFHGDHCLGLPGIIQRFSLDRIPHTVEIHFPASGAPWYERLRHASIFDDRADVVARPVSGPGVVAGPLPFTLEARPLDHRVDAVGWRIQEPDGRRMLPDRLAAAGITGPAIARLRSEGRIEVGDRTVPVEDMSVLRRGQVFAFVMDTRICDAAIELARGADLLVCESTFLTRDHDLAQAYGHMTAAQAATVAREAGARKLVLTHFSQRYTDDREFLEEASAIFPDVVVARDLDRIEVPKRVT